jgi:four helix bundle protein
MFSCNHRDLIVWQKSMDLALESHAIADELPSFERFALTDQIRRSAGSIPANLAEGSGRFYSGDFLHHVSFARGSLMELDTHLEIALRRRYLTAARLSTGAELIDHVGRMLTRLGISLQRRRRDLR